MKKALSLILAVAMVLGLMSSVAVAEDVTPQVAIGNSIYDFSTTDLATGETVTGADLFSQATLTVINFWSTGCGPCLNEMPYFQRIHEMYGGTGTIQIVGVISSWFGGTPQNCLAYLQSQGYTYQNLIPDTILNAVPTSFGGLPVTIYCNNEGEIIAEDYGGVQFNYLHNKVRTLFEQLGGEYPTYNVTFVDGLTDEVIDVQAVEIGGAATPPTPPEHEGYTFGRWEGDYDIIVGDITVTAIYVPRTYRVDFYDSITGERIAREYVQYGNAAPAPEPPVHEGYTFVGWDVDFSRVTSNLTVNTIYTQNGEGDDPIPGDVNGDGNVTAADAMMALRYSVGAMTLTPDQLSRADINGDGNVTAADAMLILRLALS